MAPYAKPTPLPGGAGVPATGRHAFGAGKGVATMYILLISNVCAGIMTKKYRALPKTSPHVEEPKVAMSYRLSPGKIARAQRVLGTPTATSTIEEALDLVVFRRELIDGVESAFGVAIDDAFPASSRRKRR